MYAHIGRRAGPPAALPLQPCTPSRSDQLVEKHRPFKGFVTALKLADPMLVVLPYSASKQHYTTITTNTQVQTLDENKMLQYFQPY
jgi:hypothetical protein